MAISFLSGAGKEKKELHKVTIDGLNYPYYANAKVYTDTGSVVGVTIVKPNDDLQPSLPLKAMIASGRLRYINVSDVDGNVFRLLCVGDSVKTALGNVKKKKIDGKAINTAWIPSRVSFR
jgi:hypothetical protein